jgi:hypothetical protein
MKVLPSFKVIYIGCGEKYHLVFTSWTDIVAMIPQSLIDPPPAATVTAKEPNEREH